MTLFDRYLLKRFASMFVMMFLAILGLYIVIDGFTNMDGFQQSGASNGLVSVVTEMATYYTLHTSLFFDTTAGPLAVISALSVLAMAARQRELYAIFSSGIPAYRLLMPLILGMLLVSGLLTINQEWIIPSISHRLLSDHGQGGKSGRPLQPLYDRNQVHIAGQRVHPTQQIVTDIAVSLPSPEMADELTTLHAAQAVYFPATATTPQGFMLKDLKTDLTQLHLTAKGSDSLRLSPDFQEAFLVTDVTIDQLCDREHALRMLGTRDLAKRVQHSAGLFTNTHSPLVLLHTRMVRPIVMVLSLLLSAPLVIRRESRNLMVNMAMGMSAVVVLLMMGMLSESFAQTELLTASQAAWLPCVVGGAGAAWVKDLMET